MAKPKVVAAKKAPAKRASKREVSQGYEARAAKLVEALLSFPGEAGALLDRVEQIVTTAKGAAERYKREHWGKTPPKGLVRAYAADPGAEEVIPALGHLYAVVYSTRKGSDATPQLYEHKFAKTRPLLCYSPKQGGLLIIAGGSYKVTERGIEG